MPGLGALTVAAALVTQTFGGCPTGDVELFAKWEVAVNLPPGNQFKQPSAFVYNASNLDAVATITLPTTAGAGTAGVTDAEPTIQTQIPGFWTAAAPVPAIVFRYAPSRTGKHAVSFAVNGVASTPFSQCTFNVVARSASSDDVGFIDVGANGQHFVGSATKTSWFGVGENLGWVNGAISKTVQESWGS